MTWGQEGSKCLLAIPAHSLNACGGLYFVPIRVLSIAGQKHSASVVICIMIISGEWEREQSFSSSRIEKQWILHYEVPSGVWNFQSQKTAAKWPGKISVLNKKNCGLIKGGTFLSVCFIPRINPFKPQESSTSAVKFPLVTPWFLVANKCLHNSLAVCRDYALLLFSLCSSFFLVSHLEPGSVFKHVWKASYAQVIPSTTPWLWGAALPASLGWSGSQVREMA